jgi:hypothetical protein
MGSKIFLDAPEWTPWWRGDEDFNTNDASTLAPIPLAGLLTHAHARKLNHQVSSFLSSCPSCLDLGDTCTLVLIGNQREDQKGRGLALAGFGLQHNTNLWWSPWLHTDSDWDVLALVGKAYQVYFPMDPTSYPYHVRGACSHCFIVTFFSVCGAALPNFWAVSPCIKLGPLGTRPRVGGWPKHSLSHPLIYLYVSRATGTDWVLFRSS